MASQGAGRTWSGDLVVQSLGWNLLVAAARMFGALVCVLAAASGAGGPAGQAGLAVLAAATVLVAARGLRSGLFLGPDGVVVRNTLRSYRLSWDEIEEVAPPPRRRRFYLCLTVRGGRRIAAHGCCSHSLRELERMASAVRAARPGGAEKSPDTRGFQRSG